MFFSANAVLALSGTVLTSFVGVTGPVRRMALDRRLRVPKNHMFIATPGDRFPHRIEDLGGVRVLL